MSNENLDEDRVWLTEQIGAVTDVQADSFHDHVNRLFADGKTIEVARKLALKDVLG